MARFGTRLAALAAVVVAAAWTPRAIAATATINDRVIVDGCEAGGGGNDIQSIQSHYEPKEDRIVVTLRLCDSALPNTTYRIHLDHAAPFVGKRRSTANCASTADTIVARAPGGHRGVGTSELDGNTVRFVIPLAPLHVGKPKATPLIPLWATSTMGGKIDRVPNRESGDGCAHPQATTETLVQSRVAVTGLAFVSGVSFAGEFTANPRTSITIADLECQQAASQAGYPDSGNIYAWVTNSTSNAGSHIVDPGFGPIQTADGAVVASSISAFGTCDPIAGNQCLQNPINKDVHGNLTDDFTVWTGTAPDGTNAGGELQNCNDWTSNSASDIGTGGSASATNAGFTTGVQDSCDNAHHVLCVQFE
ncbi:MAG: hypothetical protein U1E45_13185 [Geminicoccaceae bacterium]